MRQACKHMVRILPHCLGYDQWSIFRNVREDIHSVALAVDEAVLLGWIERMRTNDFSPKRANCLRQSIFKTFLRRPAELICGGPKIGTGNQVNGGLCMCRHITHSRLEPPAILLL